MPEEERKGAPGGRYNRGGYRNKQGHRDIQVGEERPPEKDESIALDENLLDGESLGPQDPNAFPKENSDVGGPPDKGGLGVPEIAKAAEPASGGDRQREIDQLESEVDKDPKLTPQRSEEDEIVEKKGEEVEKKGEEPEQASAPDPEPQPTPEDLPSDEAALGELEEEPVEETKAEGAGITKTQLDEEASQAAEQETPEEPAEAEAEDEDDVEITKDEDAEAQEETSEAVAEDDVEITKDEDAEDEKAGF